MSTIRMTVDVDVEDALAEMSDEFLIAAIEERELDRPLINSNDLNAIYEEFRRRGDAPECLRDFLYKSIGKIL